MLPISTDRYPLKADEFRFKLWFTVLEEHCHDFTKICIQLVERCRLRVSSRKTWNVSDEQAGNGIAFHDGSEAFHGVHHCLY